MKRPKGVNLVYVVKLWDLCLTHKCNSYNIRIYCFIIRYTIYSFRLRNLFIIYKRIYYLHKAFISCAARRYKFLHYLNKQKEINCWNTNCSHVLLENSHNTRAYNAHIKSVTIDVKK